MFWAAVIGTLIQARPASPTPSTAEPAYISIQNPLAGSSPGILLKLVMVNSSWGWAGEGLYARFPVYWGKVWPNA